MARSRWCGPAISSCSTCRAGGSNSTSPAPSCGGAPRTAATTAGFASPLRGWERLYVDHVQQADTGADLDFLIGSSGGNVSRDSH